MKSTINAIILILGFVAALPSLGNGSSVQDLNDLIAEARARSLTYLPDYLTERNQSCKAYGDGADQCFAEARQHAVEVLSCPTSSKRYVEGIEHDRLQAEDSFLKNGQIEVPAHIRKQFDALVKAVRDEQGKPFHFDFTLEAYKGSSNNAHSSVGGRIFMGEGVWNGPVKLTLEDITAILAHEIAHVILQHGMKLNCMAMEWTSSNHTIHEAQRSFIEDFQGSLRFKIWSKLSQDLEYEADANATRILRKAGMDPLQMARVLEKLRPKETGGFKTGSHPDFDVRIEAARKAAKNW